jgi:hypothetical protein
MRGTTDTWTTKRKCGIVCALYHFFMFVEHTSKKQCNMVYTWWKLLCPIVNRAFKKGLHCPRNRGENGTDQESSRAVLSEVPMIPLTGT